MKQIDKENLRIVLNNASLEETLEVMSTMTHMKEEQKALKQTAHFLGLLKDHHPYLDLIIQIGVR